MSKQKLLIISIIGLLLCVTEKEVFAQFTITGELRPRTEFRNGFKKLRDKSADPAFFIEQRSRLYINYKKDKIELNIALQDVRMWGSLDQIYKTDPTLQNVYEAWAKYSFNDKFAFKLGRMAMDYNNARFMGNLDWAQQGRSHDAFMFLREDKENNSKLHLAFAYNQQIPFEPGKLSGNEYLGVKNYKTMIFGWWDKRFEKGGMSVLFHNDGRQVQADSSMAYRQTYGLIGDYTLGKIKLDGELYYQGGNNSKNISINALMVMLHGTLKTKLTPITLGFEYVSGTSLADNTDKSFNPLYGTNHKFNGFMDYFYVGNPHGQGGKISGLLELHLKTKFKLGEKSNLLANLHYFASPVKIYKTFDTSGETYGSTLGTELDLVYTLVLTKDVKLNLGYSHMFATETMEAVKGGGDKSALQNWAWAMIAFKPQLFTTAK